MSGLDRINAERQRQITEEGWSSEHDDEHYRGEMASAAACYALESCGAPMKRIGGVPDLWPWHFSWWKPAGRLNECRSDARIRMLAKAGALIAAEIDRLERRAALEDDNG